ncbi:hypothetical protein L3X38_037519 [Prunus dulcis]|uniref:Uncharacterized protein n=1 Tax=Prunus dulcis TaxID=3755 RepID=A0AAD4YPM1_PRUDU|nr:hypothetical protein L3X38_037519 [Prunus dulcis]
MPVPNLPAEVYHSQNSPWPFMQWAIDLVGHLPRAPAKKEMMIVAADYLNGSRPKLYPILKKPIWSYSSGKTSSVGLAAHSRWLQTMARSSLASRSQPSLQNTRSSNTSPPRGAEGKWVDELPGVLWAHRTTKRRLTGKTPFSLAYGTEAIIPPHITVPSISLEVGSLDQNSEQMRLNLDLLEGEREKTIIQVASYQQLKSYYDKRAKVRQFQPGDLVLRKAFITAQRQGSKKMNPNWEGPYVISRAGGRGSYTLDTVDGKEIPRQWNAYHLQKYYP